MSMELPTARPEARRPGPKYPDLYVHPSGARRVHVGPELALRPTSQRSLRGTIIRLLMGRGGIPKWGD